MGDVSSNSSATAHTPSSRLIFSNLSVSVQTGILFCIVDKMPGRLLQQRNVQGIAATGNLYAFPRLHIHPVQTVISAIAKGIHRSGIGLEDPPHGIAPA